MIKKFISLAAVAASIFGCSGSDTVAADGDGHIASGVKKGTMTDPRDGHKYKTVKIGTQTWMAENLNYDYNEGSAQSFCYHDNPVNCQKYGRLYLWAAAMDSAAVFSRDGARCGYGRECEPIGLVRGVCPAGWHLPSKDEWDELISAVGGKDIAGRMLKSTSGWANCSEELKKFQEEFYEVLVEIYGPNFTEFYGEACVVNGNGTNSSGFSALPAGIYDSYDKEFYDLSYDTKFWSSTEYDSGGAYRLRLSFNDRGGADVDFIGKGHGFSVRCLQD